MNWQKKKLALYIYIFIIYTYIYITCNLVVVSRESDMFLKYHLQKYGIFLDQIGKSNLERGIFWTLHVVLYSMGKSPTFSINLAFFCISKVCRIELQCVVIGHCKDHIGSSCA